MRRTVVHALLVLAGVLLFSSVASACSCMPPSPPEEALEKMDAVFTGEVTGIEDSASAVGPRSSARDVYVTFDVSEVWKGPAYETLVVTTAASSASCGYNFEEGEAYLVYATGPEDDLDVSLCSRTAPLADAEDDIAALRNGTKPSLEGQNTESSARNTAYHVLLAATLLLAVTGLYYRHRYRHRHT